MKKQFLFIALCVSAAALLLAGCDLLFKENGNDGNGKTVTITSVEDLSAYLTGLPWNDAGSPYTVVLKGLNIRAGWDDINDAVREAEQYVALDLSACSSGREITGSSGTPSDSDFNIIRDNEYIRAVTLPNTLKSIGDYAFYGCGYLTSVTIPVNVTSIGSSAFYGCRGLTSITIPASVTSIGNSAFSECASLSAITVDAANGAFLVHGGVLYDNPVTRVVAVPAKLAGAVTIHSGVISVGGFGGTAITSISIPSSVTSIENDAFSACAGLTSVTIPDSVTSIGSGAFFYCTKLTSITIGNGVTSIGGSAFSYCTGLTSITIPGSVTSIEYGAFSGCTGLTSVTIPASVTSIGDRAFHGCTGLTSVTFETGSNITSSYFGSIAFPEGSDGQGGNALQTAYLAADPHSGTYTRPAGGSVWTKQQ
ncbi:MAG: leucine-rich repeat domain-containing protein [Treponematales bacterium]